ncbi:hypothetical protein [Daejeonella lutea]|uniref:Lipoprotein n=1 Tax=Daejeonella lutea TaxID=572036 RepID=A0A1T4ZWU0_9SPHI|nr:hypothetical protein [Daejeonella lutea]SKB27190.1 hypothetical protein SAMN05661099_0029 [Daejeonella lutea]
MKEKILGISLMILLSACALTVTEEDKQTMFNNASFDNEVISRLPKYQEFRSFLELNADTIFNYVDSLVAVGKGSADSILKVDFPAEGIHVYRDCMQFRRVYKNHQFTAFPDHLREDLNNFADSIGERNLAAFTLCRDKTVLVQIREQRTDQGLTVIHSLTWDKIIEQEQRYHKDTLLAEDCIYHIALSADTSF